MPSRYRRFARFVVLSLLLSPVFVLFGCPPDDPDPELVVAFGDDSPSVIEQSIEEGGDPVDIDIALSNTGTCDLDFSVSWSTVDGADWLVVDVTSGTVGVGAVAPLTVRLDVGGPPELLAGTYTGSVVIDGECALNHVTAAGSPIVIAVNLIVTPITAAMEVDNDRIERDTVTFVDEWEPLSTYEAPEFRARATAVWTGSRMIVWGGDSHMLLHDSGGVYEPFTDTWTPTALTLAPSPRVGHTAVWTGSEMWVMGGTFNDIAAEGYLDDGALYEPLTNTWTPAPDDGGVFTARANHTAIRTGDYVIWWGGRWDMDSYRDTGALYNTTNGSWTATSLDGAPTARHYHTAVWTGERMIVWGGETAGALLLNDGAMYDPDADDWQAMTAEGAPDGRVGHSAVWTGKEMIVWGGYDSDYNPLNDGGCFDPYTNRWRPISTDGAPSMVFHSALWTGSRMVVWGVDDMSMPDPEPGGVYDPATDTWTAMSIDQAPTNRARASAVWTGEALLIWGGWHQGEPSGVVYPEGGGIYR